MEKHYVGSEIGQLRSVMLHRPNLSLKRLTPSNCQELLFDDVSVSYTHLDVYKRQAGRDQTARPDRSLRRPWRRGYRTDADRPVVRSCRCTGETSG